MFNAINQEKTMQTKHNFLDKIIVHMGDTWRVIGVGAQRDGNTFCHLASTHNGRQQKNGWMPHQIGDWVDTAVLRASANQVVRDFFGPKGKRGHVFSTKAGYCFEDFHYDHTSEVFKTSDEAITAFFDFNNDEHEANAEWAQRSRLMLDDA